MGLFTHSNLHDMAEPLRWGILGSGKIAEDFSTAAMNIPERAEIVSVYSREQERSTVFGGKFNVSEENCYSDLDAFLHNPETEIVYVASIHPYHFEHASAAIRAKKHVLCEKPFTMDAKQLEELIRLAKENDVFLMEALWTRYFPAWDKIREIIASGQIGPVRCYRADFGFVNPGVARLSEKQLGGGALLDIGIYVVSTAFMAFQGATPQKVQALAQMSDQQIDIQTAIQIDFGDQRLASLLCTFEAETPKEAVIIGTKGRIKILAPFWCPTEIVVTTGDQEESFSFPLLEGTDYSTFNFTNSMGLQYEAAYAQQQIRQGKKQSDLLPLDESLLIMQTLDNIRQQIG